MKLCSQYFNILHKRNVIVSILPILLALFLPEKIEAQYTPPLTGPYHLDFGPLSTLERSTVMPLAGPVESGFWSLQPLPDGLLYSSYLAGPRESRLGTAWLSSSGDNAIWDTTLGGRVGLLRWGTTHPDWPEGWQLDVEGAAFPRLNLDENEDLEGTDFRVGIPLTWRQGPWQAKIAGYHLSSHVGDEFLERNPSFQRINFGRNAFVLGAGYFVTPDLRIYAEADFGFDTDGGSEPWWFQFGFDLAPAMPTGPRGAPFLAANALLREEVDFGGTFTLMSGWSWRAEKSGHLARLGVQYSNGKTSQFEFHRNSEQLIGIGLWYDY